jgi:GNAT superfamily N-acetyltransferase
MRPKIRDIKIEDLLQVFEQLRKLAAFTGLTDMLVLTPESLEIELFKPKADWFCLVAEIDTKIAGVCLYSITNINRSFHHTPAIYVDALFVDEKYRKSGVAKKLLSSVADVAKKNNFERIELWCSKSNNIAQSTYASLGATKLEMIDVIRFDTYSKSLSD